MDIGLLKEKKEEFFYLLMKFFFIFYILFFPLGIAFREIGSVGSAVCLIFYYILGGYSFSNLKKFSLKWVYFLFLIYIVVNSTFISIERHESWVAISHNVYKGFLLILVGTEFVRSLKDLQILVLVFSIMGFYEGLDGVYQAIFGYDIVHNTKIWGNRLTGSLSTPRVGNLMSLIIPIMFALILSLKEKIKNFKLRIVISMIMLSPAIFLLYGSKTRSGWFGFLVACMFILLFFYGFSWKKILVLGCVIGSLLMWGPSRINIKTLAEDPRFELWNTALTIFKHYPVFGSGFNTYPNAYNKLGIIHKKNSNHIPHPHNIYFQLLAEGGIVGFLLGNFFLFGTFWWCLGKIKYIYKKSMYFLPVFFLASYAGYLMTAFSAHNYFRSWWLGMAMSIMGITIGSCCSLYKK